MNFNNSLELTQSQKLIITMQLKQYIKYEQVRIRGRNQKRI